MSASATAVGRGRYTAAGPALYRGVAIAFPPVHTALQLLDGKTQLRQFERSLGGSVAADAVAEGHQQYVAWQLRRGLGIDGAVRQIDGPRQRFLRVGGGRTTIHQQQWFALLLLV